MSSLALLEAELLLRELFELTISRAYSKEDKSRSKMSKNRGRRQREYGIL